DDRFEEGADLPSRLRGAVELATDEVETSDHRANLTRFVVDGQHRPFDERLLFECQGRGNVAIEFTYFALDHVADFEERGGRGSPRPLKRGRRKLHFVCRNPNARVALR